MIKSIEPRTGEQKLQCLEDMLSLTARNFEVMYWPGKEPVGGTCPVCRSTLSKAKWSRIKHILTCRRKEYKKTVVTEKVVKNPGGVEVKYCFLCFRWIDDDTAWEEHCRGHLNTFRLTWCTIRVYCHTVVSPGFCSWCLVNEGPSAGKRFKQWTRNCTLVTYIETEHVQKIKLWPASYGCGTAEKGAVFLYCHLNDVHGLGQTEWRRFDIKRRVQEHKDPLKRPRSRMNGWRRVETDSEEKTREGRCQIS